MTTQSIHTVSPTTPPPDADAVLIAGLKAGDGKAFEDLLALHGGRMLAVARRYMGNEQDAQDALQDAMLCVFRKAHKFEERSRLSTWLHRVVVNACLMKLRSQKSRLESDIDPLLPTYDDNGHHQTRVTPWDTGPAADVEQSDTRRHVRECIEQLPVIHRTVLLLRAIEQLDTEEVAKLLGCSTDCVKTRLHRARQALRTLLDPTFGRHYEVT